MQLIEIVQLALVGFIVISLLIFLFSYAGYRAKSKKNDLEVKPKLENKLSIDPTINVKLTEPIIEKKIIDKPVLKTEIVKSNKEKTNKTKFEIFKPSTDKTKVHNPKIIISDITKETGKKLK